MSEFQFKKNTHEAALQEKPKPGRPRVGGEVRQKPVSCYLTKSEYEKFTNKLDGRPASSILRQLILQFTADHVEAWKDKNAIAHS